MGIFEGLVGGFGESYAGHQKEAAARTARRTEQEQQILSTLLSSDNPEIQMRAMQAMIQGASGSPKKKGGISGFLGETEPSPAFTSMFDYLRKMDEKSRAGTPDTVTNTMEDGTPTQTITAGAEGTPTTLFETRQQGREAEAALRPAARPPTRQTQVISTDHGQFLVDSQTGTVIQEYDPKAGGGQAPTTRGVFMEDARGQRLVDPTTGQTIATFGPKPRTAGAEAPRDEPGYLNARAAQEQIDRALEAQFGKMALDAGLPSQRQEIQAARDALAVKFGFQSYDDVLRNAATRRGEMGMSTPPSAEGGQGISGQGEAVDTQRATEIMEAGRSGKIPTPEEQQFIRQYLRMYEAQLEP